MKIEMSTILKYKLLIILFFCASLSNSQNTVLETPILSGEDIISSSSNMFIANPNPFLDTTPDNPTFVNLKTLSYLKLKINADKGYNEAYTTTVVFDVYSLVSPNVYSTNATEVTLTVSYSPEGNIGNKINTAFKGFENIHGLKVVITGVTTSNRSGANIIETPNNIDFYLGFQSDFYSKLDLETAPTFTNAASTNNLEALVMSWAPIDGALYYELEWTWVDSYDKALDGNDIRFTLKDFELNNTRIQANKKDRAYSIPLIYDEGFILYRVRAVGAFLASPAINKYGAWSSNVFSNVEFINGWTDKVYWAGDESKKNWQFQASYAEDGKKKEVVSYFDGTLRNRQTVTKINSDDNAIVGEVIYDNQGRPAIEVLPVPTIKNVQGSTLKYYENFSLNTDRDPYTHNDFDWVLTTEDNCIANTDGMSDINGAGRYYGRNFRVDTEKPFQSFVPDAEGFPFSQIQYTPDNTGRIKAKGGVGPTHQLGTNHEMKYIYGTPDEGELERLFGTNVGNLVHYKKNTVIDPNNQLSISYIDPQGRTIATALGADNPKLASGLDRLISLDDENAESLHLFIETDFIKINESRSSGYYGDIDDILEVNKELILTSIGETMTFNYELTQINSFQPEKCSDLVPYVYDLEISLIDDCGNEKLSEVIKGTIGEDQTYKFNTNIPRTTTPNIGAYSLTKTLKVNQEALDTATDAYIAKLTDPDNTDCYIDPLQFIPQGGIDGCFTNCEECVDSLVEGDIVYARNWYIEFLYIQEQLQDFYGNSSFALDFLHDATFGIERDRSVSFNIDVILWNDKENEAPLIEEEVLSKYQLYKEEFRSLAILCRATCNTEIPNSVPNSVIYDTQLKADVSLGGQYGSNVLIESTNNEGNLIKTIEDPLSVFNDNNSFNFLVEAKDDDDTTGNTAIDQQNNWRNSYLIYNDDTGAASKIVVKGSLNNGYLPEIISGITPTISTNIDGESFEWVRPQDLLHVEDFFDNWQPTWADALVVFHPEHPYSDFLIRIVNSKLILPFVYRSIPEAENEDPEILNINDVYLNEDQFNSYLENIDDFELAKRAFDFFGDDIYSGILYYDVIPSYDEVFDADLANIHEEIVKIATGYLASPAYEGEVGLSMLEYTFKAIVCENDPDPDCGFTRGSITWADVEGLSQGQQNKVWNLYKSLYLSLKARIKFTLLSAYAKRKGQYNSCIETDSYVTPTNITSSIRNYPDQADVIEDYANGGISPRLCSDDFSSHLYSDKIRRFVAPDGQYDPESDVEDIVNNGNADYEIYLQTGRCPLSFDLEYFLDELFTETFVNTAGNTVFNIGEINNGGNTFDYLGNYLTNDLKTAVNATGNIEDIVVNKSGASIAIMVDGNTLTNLVLPATYNWNNYSSNGIQTGSDWSIISLSNLYYEEGSSSPFTFKILAQIRTAGQEPIQQVLLSGTTTAAIGQCTTAVIDSSSTDNNTPPVNTGVGEQIIKDEAIKILGNNSNCEDKESFEKSMLSLMQTLHKKNDLLNTTDLSTVATYTSDGFLPEYIGDNYAQATWLSQANNVFTIASGEGGGVFDDAGGAQTFVYLEINEDLQGIINGGRTIDFVSFKLLRSNDGNYNQVEIGCIENNDPSTFAYFNGRISPSLFACECNEDVVEGENGNGNGNGNGNEEFCEGYFTDFEIGQMEQDLLNLHKYIYDNQLYLEENLPKLIGNLPIFTKYVKLYFASRFTSDLSLIFTEDSFDNFKIIYAAHCTSSSCSNTRPGLAFLVDNIPYTFFTHSSVNLYDRKPVSYSLNIANSGSDIPFYPNDILEKDDGTEVDINVVKRSNGHEFDENGVFSCFNCISDSWIGYFTCDKIIRVREMLNISPPSPQNNTLPSLPNYPGTDYNCTTCQPQPLTPVACNTEIYNQFLQVLDIDGTTGESNRVNGYSLGSFYDYDSFCNYNMQYLVASYNTYLTALSISQSDDPNFLSLIEFGDTNLNKGYTNINLVINNYAAYTGDLNWNDYVNQIYLDPRTTNVCPPMAIPSLGNGITIPLNNDESDCTSFVGTINGIQGSDIYTNYIASLRARFVKQYLETALQSASETFTVSKYDKEYQYTLYYYDQAGNLVQTVPPEGVNRLTAAEVTSNNEPTHSLKTQYRYNSLNQLVWQKTPDGGETRFAYDDLGRIIASQNAKQFLLNESGGNTLSYTKYDGLGRITEAGEVKSQLTFFASTDGPSGSYYEYSIGEDGRLYKNHANDDLITIINAFDDNENKRQITKTTYSTVSPLAETLGFNQSTNTRNRVTSVVYLEDSTSDLDCNNAIFYDYDIHGNVKKMGYYVYLGDEDEDKTIKTTEYNYDLISGNVKEVTYQKGEPDQFIHRYNYDADNRVTAVKTSRNGILWENDATYKYYNHGPLARTIIGDQKVQSLDYAYTIQGWLKSVNGEAAGVKDIGEDTGVTTAKDAFAYSLNYFKGDYLSVGNIINTPFTVAETSDHVNPNNLYNGNIKTMVTSLIDLNENPLSVLQNNYEYDQLNRIKAMTSHDLTSGSMPYASSYDYDRNGNLTHLTREINGVTMDSLSYNYNFNKEGSLLEKNSPLRNNRLYSVEDTVGETVFENIDIDPGQDVGSFNTETGEFDGSNYKYDAIGQLTQDLKENIKHIDWRVDGKVARIDKLEEDNTTTTISFEYDGLGNRISKTTVPHGIVNDKKSTYYIRDAQGNVMAVYNKGLLETSSGVISGITNGVIPPGTVHSGVENIVSEDHIMATNYMVTPTGNVTLQAGNFIILKPNTLLQEGATVHLFTDPNTVIPVGTEVVGLKLAEHHLYGSSRLGIQEYKEATSELVNEYKNSVGDKRYELSNHLGNVLSVISDRKLIKNDIFTADVLTYNDYFPGGMLLPNRHGSSDSYRYGFQGKEKDDEIKGEGNSMNFGTRMYDPRVVRWFSTDRIKKPWLSQYQFASNNLPNNVDPDGNDEIHFRYYLKDVLDQDGKAMQELVLSVEIIKNDNVHTFFVHNRNKTVQINPLHAWGQGDDKYAASRNKLAASEPVSGIFGLASQPIDDFTYLGRLLQMAPEVEDHYKDSGDHTSYIFNQAKASASNVDLTQDLINGTETVYAIIDGYYLLKGLSKFTIKTLSKSSIGFSKKGFDGFTVGKLNIGYAPQRGLLNEVHGLSLRYFTKSGRQLGFDYHTIPSLPKLLTGGKRLGHMHYGQAGVLNARHHIDYRGLAKEVGWKGVFKLLRDGIKKENFGLDKTFKAVKDNSF